MINGTVRIIVDGYLDDEKPKSEEDPIGDLLKHFCAKVPFMGLFPSKIDINEKFNSAEQAEVIEVSNV